MDTTKRIDTPYNNATAAFDATNSLLQENGILDSTGTEVAQLEQNPANPAWLFALACGSLHTSWQEQLAKAYSALDPQNCEEDQVLVLASIAGLSRGNGTPSHITIGIKNLSENDVVIPRGTLFKETSTNHKWATVSDVSIQRKEEIDGETVYHTERATLYCSVDGPFDVSEGTEFKVVDEESGFELKTESLSKSVLGESIETIASLRNRISSGDEQTDPVKKAEEAIGRLSGIESCSIWFNPNATPVAIWSDGEGHDITVPGRNSYIAIKGVDIDGKLAEAYFKHIDVPATTGALSSDYRRGQQVLTVKYNAAEPVTIPIHVKYGAGAKEGIAFAIKERIASFSETLATGENVTAQMVAEWLTDLGYGEIVGCTIGDDGALISDIQPLQVCAFSPDEIFVTEIGS